MSWRARLAGEETTSFNCVTVYLNKYIKICLTFGYMDNYYTLNLRVKRNKKYYKLMYETQSY